MYLAIDIKHDLKLQAVKCLWKLSNDLMASNRHFYDRQACLCCVPSVRLPLGAMCIYSEHACSLIRLWYFSEVSQKYFFCLWWQYMPIQALIKGASIFTVQIKPDVEPDTLAFWDIFLVMEVGLCSAMFSLSFFLSANITGCFSIKPNWRYTFMLKAILVWLWTSPPLKRDG